MFFLRWFWNLQSVSMVSLVILFCSKQKSELHKIKHCLYCFKLHCGNHFLLEMADYECRTAFSFFKVLGTIAQGASACLYNVNVLFWISITWIFESRRMTQASLGHLPKSVVGLRVQLMVPSWECLQLDLYEHEIPGNEDHLLTRLLEIPSYVCIFIAQNTIEMFTIFI